MGEQLKNLKVAGAKFSSAASERVGGRSGDRDSDGKSQKSGRKRRETRDAKREGISVRSEPVPSSEVHRRGGQIGVEITNTDSTVEKKGVERHIKPEQISQGNLREVFVGIAENRRRIRLLLKAFNQADYIPDENGIPISATVEALYKGADDIVWPYTEPNDKLDSELRDKLEARSKDLLEIQDQLQAYREALEETAQKENLIVEDPLVRKEAKAVQGAEGVQLGLPQERSIEQLGQLSFEEQLALLETKIVEWEGIRKEILKEGDPERLVKDLENFEAQDLGKRKVLDSVAAEVAMYRQAVAAGEKPGKREQAWLHRHLQGIDEIIVAGRTIRDRIVKERADEREKKESEDKKREQSREARRQERERAKTEKNDTVREVVEGQPDEEAVFGATLVKVKELLRQWNTLGAEFGFRELKSMIRKNRPGSIPQTGALEDWLAERTTPKAWQGRKGQENRRVILERALPEMEGLVRDAEAAAVTLREKKNLTGAVGAVSADLAAEKVAEKKTEEEKIPERGSTNVIEFTTREPIENPEQRTPWKLMDAVKQREITDRLRGLKDEYVSQTSAVLKQNGVKSMIERQQIIRRRFSSFMERVIVGTVDVPMTDSERKDLIEKLGKDIIPT